MEYKGYVAQVEFDPEAGIFHGEVVNTSDVVTFEGTSVDELQREFRKSVDVYLEFCAKHGREPERPFSGRLVLRMSPELHRQLTIEAAREHKSLNELITNTLESSIVLSRATAEAAAPLFSRRERSGRAPEKRVYKAAAKRLSDRKTAASRVRTYQKAKKQR